MGEDLGHVVYRGPEGETTVWDDVQRRFGNKPPLPEKFVPRAYAPEEDRGLRAAVERDGRALIPIAMDYGFERLEEMKTAAAIPRFGAVVEITRDSFMAHVTDPSSEHYVLVLLHRPNCPECELLNVAYRELARKHPFTKFTSIPGKECIPGYPDRNMPTLLVYRNRDPVRTFMGLGHYGGRHMTPEGLELALNECGRVCAGARGGEDEHDEGDDESTDARRAATTSERLLRRLIEDGKEELSRRAESGDDDEE